VFVTTLCVVQSIHTELAKLYSQKVIYCLANLAALFDIGHAPKDQSNRRIHLPCLLKDVQRYHRVNGLPLCMSQPSIHLGVGLVGAAYGLSRELWQLWRLW
jgi:hypothetical protein